MFVERPPLMIDLRDFCLWDPAVQDPLIYVRVGAGTRPNHHATPGRQSQNGRGLADAPGRVPSFGRPRISY